MRTFGELCVFGRMPMLVFLNISVRRPVCIRAMFLYMTIRLVGCSP